MHDTMAAPRRHFRPTTVVVLAALLSPAGAGSAPPPRAAQVENTGAGTVYFYFVAYTLPRAMNFGTPNISLYCDGQIVAKIGKQRYVGVRLPLGRYTFATKGLRTPLDETAIQLDVGADTVTFVRLEVGIGNLKWWAHLRVVGEDEGSLMVATLNPVPADLIKDRSRATIERPVAGRFPATEPPLTNADIIALERAGLEDETVLLKIRLARTAFDASPASIEALQREGVSEAVVTAMMERASGMQGRER